MPRCGDGTAWGNSVHLFVYYKVEAHQAMQTRDRLGHLMRAIQAELPDVRMQVLKRPEADAAGLETWMETYEFPDAQQSALQQALDGLVARLELPSKRAAEVFVGL